MLAIVIDVHRRRRRYRPARHMACLELVWRRGNVSSWSRIGRRDVCREVDRERQRERAADAGLTLDQDVAAQQTGEVPGDGESEAGAAVLAMSAAVRLPERIEDDVQLVRWNADPRITHSEGDGACRRSGR